MSAATDSGTSPMTMDPFLMLEFIKPREKLSTFSTIGRAFGAVTNDRLNSNEKTLLLSPKLLKPDVIFGRYVYLRKSLLERHGAEVPPQIYAIYEQIDELKRRVFTNYKAVLSGVARPSDLPISIKDLTQFITKVEMLEPSTSTYRSELQELRRFVYYIYDLYRAKMKERGIEITKEAKETRRILSAMPAVPTGKIGTLDERYAALIKPRRSRRSRGSRRDRKTRRGSRRDRKTRRGSRRAAA